MFICELFLKPFGTMFVMRQLCR